MNFKFFKQLICVRLIRLFVFVTLAGSVSPDSTTPKTPCPITVRSVDEQAGFRSLYRRK